MTYCIVPALGKFRESFVFFPKIYFFSKWVNCSHILRKKMGKCCMGKIQHFPEIFWRFFPVWCCLFVLTPLSDICPLHMITPLKINIVCISNTKRTVIISAVILVFEPWDTFSETSVRFFGDAVYFTCLLFWVDNVYSSPISGCTVCNKTNTHLSQINGHTSSENQYFSKGARVLLNIIM